MGRPKKSEEKHTERQLNYEPASFHLHKDLKKRMARFVFEQKQEGTKMSQEIFINEAIKERCEKLGI